MLTSFLRPHCFLEVDLDVEDVSISNSLDVLHFKVQFNSLSLEDVKECNEEHVQVAFSLVDCKVYHILIATSSVPGCLKEGEEAIPLSTPFK